jgi:hypothetical protein
VKIHVTLILQVMVRWIRNVSSVMQVAMGVTIMDW